MHGDDVEVNRTDQRGVYAGATQAYLGDRVAQVYTATAAGDLRCRAVRAAGRRLRHRRCASGSRWPMHLLEGLFFGMRNSQTILGERERLLALGSLSAGLTHELNNPAAAAVRATAVLRDRVAGMRHKLAMIADGRLDGTAAARAGRAAGGGGQAGRRRAAADVRVGRPATPRTRWPTGWRSTASPAPGTSPPTLVAGGIDVAWLEQVAAAVGADEPRVGGALADVHGRHRAADGRDRRRGHPDLRPGRARPSSTPSSTGRRYQTVDVHDAARRHAGDAAGEDPGGGHGGQGVRPDPAADPGVRRPS